MGLTATFKEGTVQPRLSGLAGRQKIHCHAYAEGITSAFCGCGYMLSNELWALQALPWPKLIMSNLF